MTMSTDASGRGMSGKVTLEEFDALDLRREVHEIDAHQPTCLAAILGEHGRRPPAAGIEQRVLGRQVTLDSQFEGAVGMLVVPEVAFPQLFGKFAHSAARRVARTHCGARVGEMRAIRGGWKCGQVFSRGFGGVPTIDELRGAGAVRRPSGVGNPTADHVVIDTIAWDGRRAEGTSAEGRSRARPRPSSPGEQWKRASTYHARPVPRDGRHPRADAAQRSDGAADERRGERRKP